MTNKFSIQPVSWSYEKTSAPNPSNSLSRLPHVWRIWKNLLAKSFQFSISRLSRVWMEKEKTHHQIFPILYPDYHMFGGDGKTSSPKPSNSLSRLLCVWMEKEKTHHQILPILYLDYHMFGGYGKTHHQILPILVPDYHVLGWKRKKLITKSFQFSI